MIQALFFPERIVCSHLLPVHPSVHDAELSGAENLVGEDLVGLADVSLLPLLLLFLLLLLLGRGHCHTVAGGTCNTRRK